jgi:hypothetical protein
VLDCGDAGEDAGVGDEGGSGVIDSGPNQDSGLPLSVSCRRLAMGSGPQGGVCVIAADGTVQCSDVPVPTLPPWQVKTVPKTSGARCISGGESFLCLVTTAGGVACWGGYPFHSNNGSNTPVPVAGLESGVIDLAAGETHACALLNTGAVECWGGDPGEANTAGGAWPATPTPVALGSPATAITSGDGFSCAIVAGGAILCWGNNQQGELGSRAPA